MSSVILMWALDMLLNECLLVRKLSFDYDICKKVISRPLFCRLVNRMTLNLWMEMWIGLKMRISL